MAHAYFVGGEAEEGIGKSLRFAETALGLAPQGDPDLIVLRYGLFTVDDARKLLETCLSAPTAGEHKAVIVSVTRFFHEAQNALLKLFEEPPDGVTLVLVLPAEGLLLPTLRSRLVELPVENTERGVQRSVGELAQAFLAGDAKEREKLTNKLIDRSKSDKDEEKQQARSDAVRLVEDLIRTLGADFPATASPAERRERFLLLDDLTHFLPLLHTRSAPLKLIFEHIRLTYP